MLSTSKSVLLPDPSRLAIYSDGSYKRGRGAWAYVVVQNEHIVKEASGSAKNTTSLRMEMQAIIEGLSSLDVCSTVTLFSDCRILVDAFTFKATEERRGKNADLLSRLAELNRKHDITWKWVRAHSGIEYNERCDQLCLLARKN